jgi:integrase
MESSSRSLSLIEHEIACKQSVQAMRRSARDYTSWCTASHLLAWPVSYRSIAQFLVHYVDKNLGSAKSVDNVLSHLRSFCTLSSQPWLSYSEVRRVRLVSQRLKFHDTTPIRRVLPLTLDILLPLVRSTLHVSRSITDLLTAAALMLGHDALLRSSELLALQVQHLVFHPDCRALDITILRSKCNQFGAPEVVRINDYTGLSAYKLVQAWLQEARIVQSPSAYVFPLIQRYGSRPTFLFALPMRRREWITIIKTTVTRHKLDPHLYSGHSLRAGGATDLFKARLPTAIIGRMGRWRSDAVLKYYRDRDDVSAACAEAFSSISLTTNITMGEARTARGPDTAAARRDPVSYWLQINGVSKPDPHLT